MNLTHRYSNWLPLNSQQMRLRNLQCIQGINFNYQPQHQNYTVVFIYYSLHLDPKSESFYQSEKLKSGRCLYLKWADIECETLSKSNLNCVCVKVWACWPSENNFVKAELQQNDIDIQRKLRDSFPAVNIRGANSCNELIFSCGVYFSGLTPVYPNESKIHKSNSLLFQINDNYFTFHENLTMDSFYQQFDFNNYECPDSCTTKLDLATKQIHAESSSSPSVISTNTNAQTLFERGKRYLKINYIHSKIKISYNLEKLLKLQNLQRKRLQFQKETIGLSSEIKQYSLRCITSEQLGKKSTTQSIYPPYLSINSTASSSMQKNSMGRTLSLLLSERHRVNPHQLLQAQQLQQQVELFANKQRLLQHICDALKKEIMESRKYLQSLTISRQRLERWLEVSTTALQAEKFNWMKSHSVRLEMKIKKRKIVNSLERRMASLCIELREIYPVASNHKGHSTVCGIPFLSTENSLEDFSSQSSLQIAENISMNALSASLSYLAHLIQMIAVIINCPLRNPIVYEGPRSHILKSHKPPFLSRKELPLYSKISVPIEPLKCTLILLDQNVCQLRYYITNSYNDDQTVMHNLLHIFTTLAKKCEDNGNERLRHQECAAMLSKSSELNDRIDLPRSKIEIKTPIIHVTCDQTQQKVGDTNKLSSDVNLLMNINNIVHNENTITNSESEQNKNDL